MLDFFKRTWIHFRRFTPYFLNKQSFDSRISIGAYTYGIKQDTILLYRADDSVTVGKYCSVASDVKIIASGEHNMNAVSTFPFYAYVLDKGPEKDTFCKGRVVIGNDVWIGHGAIILSGVSIGDGAVIAAGAVVNSEVPPYAIAGGVPAKIISYRFPPAIIEDLLAVRWWDWDINKLKSNIDDFYLDVAAFIKKHK
jgi:acetyltransferase-like isoleucine patch superfamily enzyme